MTTPVCRTGSPAVFSRRAVQSCSAGRHEGHLSLSEKFLLDKWHKLQPVHAHGTAVACGLPHLDRATALTRGTAMATAKRRWPRVSLVRKALPSLYLFLLLAAFTLGAISDTPPIARAAVSAKITLFVSPTSVHPGSAVHFSGSVPRNHLRATVTIQRRIGVNGTWSAWRRLRLSSASSYATRWTAAPVAGDYYFRTVYPGDSRYRRSYSATRLVRITPQPADLLQRFDLLYGAEIGCWLTDGDPAVNPSTGIPSKIMAAGVPVIRFSVYDVFTDMTDPRGNPGTISRTDFDHAIAGIVTTLHAIPWFTFLPVAREAVDRKPGTVFVPPLSNLGRDLPLHEAILAELRQVYGGPIIIESDNEGEYDCYRAWGFANAGSVGVSQALGDKYVATMPALKKYARDVLGFAQVVTVGNIGVPGGPAWGQAVTPDASKPYGYAAEYESRWIDEFNVEVHNAYLAHGNDPDYIPDVESIHSYPHGPDFTTKAGYEYDDRKIYAYFRNWIIHSRQRLDAIWGSAIGDQIRFSLGEWNAGANNADGTWSGWSTPSRVQTFYRGWLRMLQGNGVTTGSGTRWWNANCFELAGEAPTCLGHFYNLIRKDGSTPAWYGPFKPVSTEDPRRNQP